MYQEFKTFIQWASQASSPTWYLADITEEVLEIIKNLRVSSHHIKRSVAPTRKRIIKQKRVHQDLLYLFLLSFNLHPDLLRMWLIFGEFSFL